MICQLLALFFITYNIIGQYFIILFCKILHNHRLISSTLTLYKAVKKGRKNNTQRLLLFKIQQIFVSGIATQVRTIPCARSSARYRWPVQQRTQLYCTGQDHPDCSGFDEICNAAHDNCFFCGECVDQLADGCCPGKSLQFVTLPCSSTHYRLPGCHEDSNCAGTMICNTDTHICEEPICQVRCVKILYW